MIAATHQPVQTIHLVGKPQHAGIEVQGGFVFACGYWFARDGGYVKVCIPEGKTAPKAGGAPKA